VNRAINFSVPQNVDKSSIDEQVLASQELLIHGVTGLVIANEVVGWIYYFVK
jgi:hypothetical protein